MPFIDSHYLPLVYFSGGILFSIVAVTVWRLVRFAIDIRVTRARARMIEAGQPHDALANEAWNRVSACRNRLRFNPNPNPEWVGPLIEEVPRLVREIAVIYYPDHPEPVHAPRVSEFARAVQFAATDIAEVLQSRRMGRLIDVSAGKTVQAWRTGRRVWNNPALQKTREILDPVYKVGKPLVQVLKYKSPITWMSLAASNAAVRTIHPAIINILARHAIDLYSGNLAEAGKTRANAEPVSPPATPVTEPNEKTARLQRLKNTLRLRGKRHD